MFIYIVDIFLRFTLGSCDDTSAASQARHNDLNADNRWRDIMAKVIFKTTVDLSQRIRLGVLLTRLSQRTAPNIHRSITTTTLSFQTSLTNLSPKNGLHLDRTELMGKGVFYLQRRHLSSGSNDEDGERGKGCVRNSMATATARSARCVSVEE